MVDNDRYFLLFLTTFMQFGPQRIKLLLEYFGSAEKVWKTDKESFMKIGMSENITRQFTAYKKHFNHETYLKELNRLGVNFVTVNDPEYPSNLLGMEDMPYVLYYRGTLSFEDSNAIAIVGSRKMTSYGKEVTQKLAGELATLGIPIVSGLAIGIDACAHTACLRQSGRCIAVLPTGLDNIVPSTNYSLAVQIVKHKGVLISEYPLYYPALKINFPRRNRIVSGLAKAVIVIEGEKKSGTLLTASSAAEQGRTVFAVPGSITSPTSAAPHFLLKNGAKLVTSVNDIVEELNLTLAVDRGMINTVFPADESEKSLLTILSREAMHLDEIVRITGLAINDISARLTIMELKGLVKGDGKGIYKKV